MIYFLRGDNSYAAVNKIGDFKKAFEKKSEIYLIEEADGDTDEISEVKIFSMIGQGSLFAKKRLVIFKNIFSKDEAIFDLFKKNAGSMKDSGDVFVFWERDPGKDVSALFKNYSEKVQEVTALKSVELDKWLEKKSKEMGLKIDKEERALMIDEAGENAEWALEGELEKLTLSERPSKSQEEILLKGEHEQQAQISLKGEHSSERARASEPPKRGLSASETESARQVKSATKAVAPSPFVFVEKMFGPRALFAVKELADSGQDVQRFIYVLLWKLKQRKMTGAYLEGIKAESQMRRDPKNAGEILEKFVAALSK